MVPSSSLSPSAPALPDAVSPAVRPAQVEGTEPPWLKLKVGQPSPPLYCRRQCASSFLSLIRDSPRAGDGAPTSVSPHERATSILCSSDQTGPPAERRICSICSLDSFCFPPRSGRRAGPPPPVARGSIATKKERKRASGKRKDGEGEPPKLRESRERASGRAGEESPMGELMGGRTDGAGEQLFARSLARSPRSFSRPEQQN